MPRTQKQKSRPKSEPAATRTGRSRGGSSLRRANGAAAHGGRAPAGAKKARDPDTARATYRVRPEEVAVRTEPALLPETPRESHGLFELVPSVARRALELGLSAREPTFHAFVTAVPEVMIEDDVVRYAARFAGARPTPNDIVYVHDF